MVRPYLVHWNADHTALEVTLAYPENYDVERVEDLGQGVKVDYGFAGEVLGFTVTIPRRDEAS